MLSESDLHTFASTGLLRLPGAFSANDARTMEEMVWHFASRTGVSRDDPSTWVSGAVPGLSPKLKRKPAFQLMWTNVVTQAVDELLEGDWDPPTHCGFVMVTFPNVPEWHLPHGIWHSDTHFAHDPTPLFGVKTFGFINSVGPRQGGTCVVSGSHRLVERFRQTNPRDVETLQHHRISKSHPWLADLMHGPDDPDRVARLFTPADVDGVEVRVVELAGEPGDIVLVHPWVLHCIAPNATDRPRMMTSRNLWRRGVEPVLKIGAPGGAAAATA
jgi:hypothetical protein